MITGVQVKMALAALGWTNAELATAAQVAVNTVSRFANDKGATVSTMTAIQRALEAAGVGFVEDAEHVGVMIPKPGQPA